MPTSVANPTPNPNPGRLNAVANDDGSITIYSANGCYVTRFGGSPLWRANNPGGLLTGTDDGGIGTDPHQPMYPDEATGREAIAKQIADDSRGGHRLNEALSKFGHDNGLGDAGTQTLLNKMNNAGVDTSLYWNSTGTNKEQILNIIIQNAVSPPGGNGPHKGQVGYIGTQTEQICPDQSGKSGYGE